MVKSQLVNNKIKSKKTKFPVLKAWGYDNGFVVLFTNMTSGTVVYSTNCSFKLGHHCAAWTPADSENWLEVNGHIILEND